MSERNRFSFAFPDGVYWIQAAYSTQWLKQFVEIARDYLQLKISSDSQDTDKKYFLALQKYCRDNPQLLIILDNVQDQVLKQSLYTIFRLECKSHSADPGMQYSFYKSETF